MTDVMQPESTVASHFFEVEQRFSVTFVAYLGKGRVARRLEGHLSNSDQRVE
jgi:hypothetical protein